MMEQKFIGIRSTALKAFIALLALLAFVLPQAAQAATSGGATIYNTVKVNYTSGTTTLFATANVSTTVNTVAALTTVTNPANQTVAAGAAVTYNYTIKSNSNGYDTYTTSSLTNTPSGINSATSTSVTASVGLWGGIVLGSGAGTITVPYGTTSQLTAGTSTVQIGSSTYTVAAISAGTAASTDGSGNLVAEVPATLTLTLISGTAVTAGSVAAGIQVGEYKTAGLVDLLTAGTPNTTGTDGTYSTTFDIASTLTPATHAGTTAVITTVSSPQVTITKTADKANANSGDTITYTITVTNTHATASTSNVTVIDPVPAYTSYVANSTTLKVGAGAAAAVSDVAGGSPLVSPGLQIGTGGVMAHGEVDIITFQVKVD
jgi:large repetitive protein